MVPHEPQPDPDRMGRSNSPPRSMSRLSAVVARRLAAGAALVIACIAASAGVAHAGSETYMGQQGLSAGNAYASGSAHTYVWVIGP